MRCIESVHALPHILMFSFRAQVAQLALCTIDPAFTIRVVYIGFVDCIASLSCQVWQKSTVVVNLNWSGEVKEFLSIESSDIFICISDLNIAANSFSEVGENLL